MDQHITYVTDAENIRAATQHLTRRGSVLRAAASRGRRRMLILTSGLVLIFLVAMIATTPPPDQRPPHNTSPAALLVPLAIFLVFAALVLVLARFSKQAYWRHLRSHGRIDDVYGNTDLISPMLDRSLTTGASEFFTSGPASLRWMRTSSICTWWRAQPRP
jgi:hypothetical protein